MRLAIEHRRTDLIRPGPTINQQTFISERDVSVSILSILFAEMKRQTRSTRSSVKWSRAHYLQRGAGSVSIRPQSAACNIVVLNGGRDSSTYLLLPPLESPLSLPAMIPAQSKAMPLVSSVIRRGIKLSSYRTLDEGSLSSSSE